MGLPFEKTFKHSYERLISLYPIYNSDKQQLSNLFALKDFLDTFAIFRPSKYSLNEAYEVVDSLLAKNIPLAEIYKMLFVSIRKNPNVSLIYTYYKPIFDYIYSKSVDILFDQLIKNYQNTVDKPKLLVMFQKTFFNRTYKQFIATHEFICDLMKQSLENQSSSTQQGDNKNTAKNPNKMDLKNVLELVKYFEYDTSVSVHNISFFDLLSMLNEVHTSNIQLWMKLLFTYTDYIVWFMIHGVPPSIIEECVSRSITYTFKKVLLLQLIGSFSSVSKKINVDNILKSSYFEFDIDSVLNLHPVRIRSNPRSFLFNFSTTIRPIVRKKIYDTILKIIEKIKEEKNKQVSKETTKSNDPPPS